jgi:hypothetical protein
VEIEKNRFRGFFSPDDFCQFPPKNMHLKNIEFFALQLFKGFTQKIQNFLNAYFQQNDTYSDRSQ